MDFIIDTLFQIFFAFFWIIALLVLWIKEKNKMKYALLIFFFPLLMLWTIYSYTNILKPRFRDIRYYTNQDYEIVSGECTIVNSGGRSGITPSFMLEEEIYYYNPRFNKVYEGKNYIVKYLPNSKYAIEVESIK
jgi:hypothetical protein